MPVVCHLARHPLEGVLDTAEVEVGAVVSVHQHTLGPEVREPGADNDPQEWAAVVTKIKLAAAQYRTGQDRTIQDRT